MAGAAAKGRFARFFWNRKKYGEHFSTYIFTYIYIYIHGGPLPLVHGAITPISSFFFHQVPMYFWPWPHNSIYNDRLGRPVSWPGPPSH